MSKKNTNVQVQEEPSTFDAASFIKEKGGVSKAIRFLHAEGKPRKEIAKLLNKRYQHVRNVLITELKKKD